MKLKSLLYGTAAVLMGTGASGGALAADPPVAAEPVEYVRVCDAFGKGFFYIPGTDTCLKIDGYVRVEMRFNETFSDDDDGWETRARHRVRFDARTETDLGLLRSMISFYQTLGPGGNSTSKYELTYSSNVTLDDAFITLSNDTGQWTIGYASSFFDFFGGYTHTGTGGHDQTAGQTLFAYTFNIGNGVSATLSLEDPYASGRKLESGTCATTTAGGPVICSAYGTFFTTFATFPAFATGTVYGGQRIPDIVANLRVDQGWGSAQIMGALRQIRAKQGPMIVTGTTFTFSAATTTAVGGDDAWGWALGAGLEVALPGVPVDFAAQGCYSEGALAYCVAGTGGALNDAVFNVATGSLNLTKAWQIGAGVSIAASPTVSVNIDGAYGDINHAGVFLDYDYWGMAGNVVWKPVGGLAISAEIQYRETNPDAGAGGITASNRWNGVFRVQRSF